MATQTAAVTPNVRINVFAIVGSVLLTAGICTAFTTWSSGFSRYMYVEDLMYADDVNHLGLSQEAVSAVSRATPTDKATMVAAGIIALVGIAAIIVAIVQYHTARGRNPGLPGVPALPRPEHRTSVAG